jgi:hypothetical protein
MASCSSTRSSPSSTPRREARAHGDLPDLPLHLRRARVRGLPRRRVRGASGVHRGLLDFAWSSAETIMIRDLTRKGAIALAVLAAGSASAWAQECRDGRSTDPNCYRANGYVCGPCTNDRGDAEARHDGWRAWRRHHRDRIEDRGDVEGKRAACEVYSRIAVIQADANERFRCGLQGPAWTNDPARHSQWCRYVPRQRVAEEQRNRSDELQRCFDKLGDFDDDRWAR